MWWVWPAVVALVFVSFDAHYFWRGILVAFIAYIKRIFSRKHPLESSVLYGLCTPTDLDLMGHMNNARYLRECDFARFHFYVQNYIWDAVRKLNGQVTLGGSTIRYRRSIDLFDRYRIETKVLCWDEKSFYLEQRFVLAKSDFVAAIAYMKQTLIKVTPGAVLREVTSTEISSPPFPEEISKWIEANAASSERLKKQL